MHKDDVSIRIGHRTPTLNVGMPCVTRWAAVRRIIFRIAGLRVTRPLSSSAWASLDDGITCALSVVSGWTMGGLFTMNICLRIAKLRIENLVCDGPSWFCLATFISICSPGYGYCPPRLIFPPLMPVEASPACPMDLCSTCFTVLPSLHLLYITALPSATGNLSTNCSNTFVSLYQNFKSLSPLPFAHPSSHYPCLKYKPRSHLSTTLATTALDGKVL